MLGAPRRVGDLGVELHAVEPRARGRSIAATGVGVGGGRADEALRRRATTLSPWLIQRRQVGGQAGEEQALAAERHSASAELADAGVGDLAAQQVAAITCMP